MATAEALGWGRGWPNCATGEIVTAAVGDLRLPVRRQVVPLVAGLVLDLEEARGDRFKREWSWGFACRAISGTKSPSNHSQGVAVDLDAPENPYLSAAAHRMSHALRKEYPGGRLLRSTMPLEAEAIARRWGFRWGGTYSTKPDPMHFEIQVTPTGAAKLIADLRGLAGRPVDNDPWPHEEEEVAPTDRVMQLNAGDMPPGYSIDPKAHMVLLADGTVQHFGTVPNVAKAGDFTRLKDGVATGPARRFVQMWAGDRYGHVRLGIKYSLLASDGTIWEFGPDNAGLMK